VQQRSSSSYKTNKRKSYKGSKKYTTRNNKTETDLRENVKTRSRRRDLDPRSRDRRHEMRKCERDMSTVTPHRLQELLQIEEEYRKKDKKMKRRKRRISKMLHDEERNVDSVSNISNR